MTEDVKALDAELYLHKYKYVLENDVTHLCLDFTDVLHDASAAEPAGTEEAVWMRAPPRDGFVAYGGEAFSGGPVGGRG